MRVLWCGDAGVSSGFAKCTHAVCDALHAAGHEVHVVGINYQGDPHSYPYRIYPPRNAFDGGEDAYGITRLPVIAYRTKPNVIVLLNDPWNVPEYLKYLNQVPAPRAPVMAWVAVDALNQDGAALNPLAHVVTWTEFATRELVRGGYAGPISTVPLGVDTSVFFPVARDVARQLVLGRIDEATRNSYFIVGVVGRNQPRKRLDLTLRYFADWITTHDVPNAMLYLHVGPTGDTGFDLVSLCKYYGLGGRVIIANPALGHGNDESVMRYIYSSFDISLTTTQGEGWGLTTLESMACGVVSIVPDAAALGADGGWARDAVMRVPCTSTAISAPLNAQAYTIGAVPSQRETVAALQSAYVNRERLIPLYKDRGLELASQLSWESSARQMVRRIEIVAEEGCAAHAHAHEREVVA